jgi:hypothetical protein
MYKANMKTCPKDKILNPITNRCISIKGAIAKKLIQDYKNQIIMFAEEDIIKLQEAGLLEEIQKKVETDKKDYSKAKEAIHKFMTKNKTDYSKAKEAIHKLMTKKSHETTKELRNQEPVKAFCSFKSTISSIPKTIILKETQLALESFTVWQNNQDFTPKVLDAKLVFTKRQLYLKTISSNYTEDIGVSSKILKYPFDKTWFSDSQAYTMKLPLRDQYTINGYTKRGDGIVNAWEHGWENGSKKAFFYAYSNHVNILEEFFPFFFQTLDFIDNYNGEIKDLFSNNTALPTDLQNAKDLINSKGDLLSVRYTHLAKVFVHFDYDRIWIPIIRTYMDDLNRIINNAPAIKKPLVIYRGVKSDYVLQGAKDHLYTTNQFISTSLSPLSALGFMHGLRCCFKRIIVLPGTRVLLMRPVSEYQNEDEVLLGNKTKFYITSNLTRIVNPEQVQYHNEYHICADHLSGLNTTIDVTDIVVVS